MPRMPLAAAIAVVLLVVPANAGELQPVGEEVAALPHVATDVELDPTLAPAPTGLVRAITPEELAALAAPEDSPDFDLRHYLLDGVPEEWHRAALRLAWTRNAAIRDYVDPAIDYE